MARQIVDFVGPDTRFVTDHGGGEICGFEVQRFDPDMAGELVIAVNSVAVRQRIAAAWRGRFTQVFAASAEVSRFANIARGVILCRQAVIEAEARIGEHSHVNVGACVAHGSMVGPYCTIGPQANVSGDCTLGAGVFVGAGAIIREGSNVGDGAYIGMGSLVSKDVPAGSRVICGRALKSA